MAVRCWVFARAGPLRFIGSLLCAAVAGFGGECRAGTFMVWARVRNSRRGALAVRVIVAGVVPQFVVPFDPMVPALAVGGCTWLVLTARFDLRRRGRRQRQRAADGV